ncbi:MAG: 3'-5' exoribonuclease [Candidatus Heimdallarchaeota archaeon]|nr:3'-5' exoribonuclease [Candidatus Heimdallarchaeota archaeon]
MPGLYHPEQIMIDLETLSVASNGLILSIGAVKVDILSQTIISEYYAVCDIQSSINNGAIIDGSTIKWWLSQKEDARQALLKEETKTELAALVDLTTWFRVNAQTQEIGVWGNGAGFDNVLLANAYKRYKLEIPWSYKQNRCYRTLSALSDIPIIRPPTTVYHSAIDDARNQAIHLAEILRTEY